VALRAKNSQPTGCRGWEWTTASPTMADEATPRRSTQEAPSKLTSSPCPARTSNRSETRPATTRTASIAMTEVAVHQAQRALTLAC
jgi:hypothetical protein